MSRWIDINVLLINCFHFKWLRQFGLPIVLALFASACIESYEPEIDGNTELISIEGSIIKGDSMQHISISTTTALYEKVFKPLKGCEVKVVDELNNEFIFEENYVGTYELAIDDDLLVYNRQYKLMITTPEGNQYESDYENLKNSIEVDSLYYEIEKKIETYSGIEISGLQIYIDIKAPDTTSRYFRWNITETYEYTSKGQISYIYDNPTLIPVIPNYVWEVYRCWKSEDVPGIYLSNTTNLSINEKKRIPLHFVSTLTDRLKIKYSLLVSQYSMSEEAYIYWDQNRIATEGSGGLYTRQPAQAITNIHCTNNSSEEVLGYFWTSSKTEKRIFIPRINSLAVNDFDCDLMVFDPILHNRYPIFIMTNAVTKQELTGGPTCFLCSLRGGSSTKPDFWN